MEGTGDSGPPKAGRSTVAIDGKFFRAGAGRFLFRAIEEPAWDGTSGSFDPTQAVAGGFTVVVGRCSSPAAIEAAAAHGLRALLAVEPDWLGLAGATRRARRHAVDAIAARLEDLAGPRQADVLGVALGLPPTPLEESAPDAVARLAEQLAARVHDQWADWLVTTTTSSSWRLPCPEEIDFLTVRLEKVSELRALRAALSAAHRMVGDRPLVLAGVPSGGDAAEWMADVALERGVAGTVSGPPPADSFEPCAVAGRNLRTVADLAVEWPSLSVVVCAYNAADTLAECLTHCDLLDFPRLEVVVVDDGSTDHTAAITRQHPAVRLVQVSHGGLSAARNAGYLAATGELIAYLDADAYPSPEWPWYLALAAAGVAGSGGPNVPPPGDGLAASVVARSPGGPVPQLSDEDRALHLPGCNMAFWREVLHALGGFDTELRSAEDLDYEWRLHERGWELGYHPAALVWHHRRPERRAYLRQQRSYGRGQAQLERRHPERFPKGRRWQQLGAAVRGASDRGAGTALPVAYRSLLWREQAKLGLLHQWGVPIAAALLITTPLGLVAPMLASPGLVGSALITVVFVLDLRSTPPPRMTKPASLRFRASVALNHMLRPLAFQWGKSRERLALRLPATRRLWPPPQRRRRRNGPWMDRFHGPIDRDASMIRDAPK